VIHGVLLVTNFFGINTIPIALNEADYVRMWVQAATTMGIYQATSVAALASAPRAAPAPAVVTPGANSGSALDSSNIIAQLLQSYVQSLPGGDLIWNFLMNPLGQTQQILIDFATNPAQALVTWGPLLFALGYQAFFEPVGWGTWGTLLSSPAWLPALLATGLSIPLGLIGVMIPPVVPDMVPAEAPAPAVQHGLPAVGVASSTPSPAPGAPASATAAGAPAGAPSATAPAATPGFAYAVAGRGDWGPDMGPTLGGRTGIKAPAATVPAAAAALPGRAQARARRRRRAAMHDHGDEFLDMDSDIGVPPDYGTADEQQLVAAMASGNGAGTLGFAGTAHNDAAFRAAGLTKLAGDEFGGGARMPMVPGTWDRDPDDREGAGESGGGGEDGSQRGSQ
jgi:PPE-repeat protein